MQTRLFVVQPTTFCNLDCKYCYLPREDRDNRQKMSFEIMKSAFDRLFSSGFVKDFVSIIWHCGEPLTVGTEYFSEALKILKLSADGHGYSNSYINGIQTNATLVNDKWCKLFKENKFRVGVSIDGPQFLHDRMRVTRRGTGTFNATLKGIKKLQEHNVDVNAICVLSDYSLDYAQEIHDFFADQRIQLVGFNLDEIEGINKLSSYQNTPQELFRFRQFITKLYNLVEKSQAFEVREFELSQGVILGTQTQRDTESRPFSVISVDHLGNFSSYSPELLTIPSDTYSNFILGNVLNTSFEKVTTSRKFIRIRDDINEGLLKCQKECNYYNICGGGSPSNKYFEHGTFRSSETLYCKLMKKTMTDVVLGEMEKMLSAN